LVGQKGLKLKVNDPDAYNFDPRTLLTNILSMYANMSSEDVFLRYVVNDTRSYKTETFEKATRILNNPKKGIVIDQERKDRFEKMVEQIREMKNEIEEEEVRLNLTDTIL
jgi:ubiquitin conjugation factor E4 B